LRRFARTPSILTDRGAGTIEDFVAYGPRMSLEARGFIGKPSTRMFLINGVSDTQVPIDDLYLLQRTGSPKEAWSIRRVAI